jgi:hypothetical protein
MLPKVKRWLARDDIDNLSKKEHNLATLSLKLQYYNTYCLYRVARELPQSSSSEPHAFHTPTPLRCGVAPPENSVTNSRADCALTQQMIGCIKATSPCVKRASAELFLDPTTLTFIVEGR